MKKLDCQKKKRLNSCRKKSLVITIVFFLQILFISHSAGEEWKPVKYDSLNHKYVYNTVSSFVDREYQPSGSFMEFYQYGDGFNRRLKCDKLGDDICTFERMKSNGVGARVVFPKCDDDDASATYCIKEFFAYRDNGSPIIGKFIKYIDGEHFDSNTKYLLPRGATSSIWSFRNEEAGRDDLYLVNFVESLVCHEICSGLGLNGSITPLNILYESKYKGDFAKNIVNGNSFQGIQWHYSPKCDSAIYTSAGECGQKGSFSSNLRLGIKFLVPRSEPIFIDSRIVDSVIDTKLYTLNQNSKIVEIDGFPMSVPRVGGVLTAKQAQNMLNLLDPQPLIDMNWSLVDNRQDKASIKQLEYIREISKDRVSGFENIWGFSTGKLQQCKNVDYLILGEVSSNAMIVDPNPARFENEEFVYDIAGMHFEPDGMTLIEGFYELKVSKALAKCLYKSSAVPVRATVSIISGENKVSTEAISEMGNYYVIKIYNINFSNPSIRIKLEFEKKSAEALPTPSPTTTKILTLKKITIKCTKGKQIKKLTGTNPKCPSGYKKVA